MGCSCGGTRSSVKKQPIKNIERVISKTGNTKTIIRRVLERY